MNQDLPQRSARYCSNNSDSERWDHFSERANDVFVCTPPRTGTTWTQTLCCLLIHGWRDFAIKPSDVSPWYDATSSGQLSRARWQAASIFASRCPVAWTPRLMTEAVRRR